VKIALAQDDVVVALNLDLVAIFGTEQDLVVDFRAADVRACTNHDTPYKTLADLGCGRDEDASAGSPIARIARERD